MSRQARLLPFVLSVLAASSPGGAATLDRYGERPMQFEQNVGQTADQVEFLARGRGYTVFLTHEGPVVALTGPSSGRVAFKMRMIGANPSPRIEALEPLPGKANYLRGNDPRRWHTDVPTFGRVRYRDVYPGVNVVCYGGQGELEYDFEVAPGASPAAIRVRFEGVVKKTLDSNGDLLLDLPGGIVRQRKPRVFQVWAGEREEIGSRYVLENGGDVQFELAGHDPTRALTIDPVLSYSTYLGGAGGGNETARAVAVAPAGHVYLVGYTDSPDLPATSNAIQPDYGGGGQDAFVAKLDTTGTELVYLSYIGGVGSDLAYALAVDATGNAFVAGQTTSPDFPTTRGALRATLGGPADGFVSALDPTGSALVYSTYLGGTSHDAAYGIAVDGSGSAYVTGYTASSDFPTTSGSLQAWSTDPSSTDAFVAKLTPAGSGLVFSTFLSGSGADIGRGIAVDEGGRSHVVGTTESGDFPHTPGAAQSYAGAADSFVTKLNPSGSAAVYSTFLGGGANDYGQAIAIDRTGAAVVAGYSNSPNFPVTNDALQAVSGGRFDLTMAKLNLAGDSISYATYLGGPGDDYGYAVATDASGSTHVAGHSSGGFPTTPGSFMPGGWGAVLAKVDASGGSLSFSTYLAYSDTTAYGVAVGSEGQPIVTGSTRSPVFQTTPGAFQATFGGSTDAFLSRLDPSGSTLEYSTFLGRHGGDAGYSIAADASGNAYVAGDTGSVDFPTSVDSFQGAAGGGGDIFVTKLNPTGDAALYSTYLGGSNAETRGGPGGIAVDAAGNVFITGHTYSPDFPVTAGAVQPVMASDEDAFVTKLNSTGNGLVYSTYLGGNGIDAGSGIAVDSSGRAFVTGWTWSITFPATPGASGPASHGLADAFLTVLNPEGASLAYSSYLGGSATDVGQAVAVDSFGNAYVTGTTESTDFPTTVGAFQASHGGGIPSPPNSPLGRDAFVSKMAAGGASLVYSTFLGGAGDEQPLGLAVDSTGAAHVVGSTNSPNFPSTPGCIRCTLGGSQDGFLTRLNPAGSSATYSTYLGGTGSDFAGGVAVDASGNAWVAGTAGSVDFPTTPDALQRALAGGSGADAFLTKISLAGGGLLYSTYLGGSASDSGRGVTLDPAGNVYLTGSTASTDFPATPGAFQEAYGGFGGSDAFVARFSDVVGSCTYSVSLNAESFPAGGGQSTLVVNTNVGCAWIASSHAPWIAIGATSGRGSGSVRCSVAENLSAAPRAGTATIAGQAISITQSAATCRYSLSSRRETFAEGEGLGTIEVIAPAGCAWTAVSGANWVTVRSGASGSGSYPVRFTVSQNLSKKRRSTTVTVADQVFSLTQERAR